MLERHCLMLSQLVTISIWTFKWKENVLCWCVCVINIITLSFVWNIYSQFGLWITYCLVYVWNLPVALARASYTFLLEIYGCNERSYPQVEWRYIPVEVHAWKKYCSRWRARVTYYKILNNFYLLYIIWLKGMLS